MWSRSSGRKRRRGATSLDKAAKKPGAPEATKGFLLAVRDCCLAADPASSIPGFVVTTLEHRTGFDAKALKEVRIWREQLKADTQMWIENRKRASYLWSNERVREAVAALKQVGPELQLSKDEQEFLGPIEPAMMVAELEQFETPHRRRALIGERLDILGDLRWGVRIDEANNTPQIDWCQVEGGKVIIEIRSDPNYPHSEVRKFYLRTVKGFRIARYLTTVAQYRAFLEAEDGWANPNWWVPDLYRDPKGNSYKFGRFNNHPAVRVNWWDAVAFCRWLRVRSGFEVQLPTEYQWQLAATGGKLDNVFPWGAEWDPNQEPYRANTLESQLEVAIAVGMYPAGASPAGALDMAGTVWEWCQNKFSKSKVIRSPADDLDFRVVRGGSWREDRDSARSAYRGRSQPDNRYDNIGFRVVSDL